MSDKELDILNCQIFNQYQIKLSYHLDIINIQIQNNYNIYESNFNLEYLNILLVSNLSRDKMIEFIHEFINQKNIKIENNEK